MEGYYFIDPEENEVFYVPRVFILMEPGSRRPQVILDPQELRSGTERLERIVEGCQIDRDYTEIDEADIQKIIALCLKGKMRKARRRCVKAYRKSAFEAERCYGTDLEDFDSGLGFDTYGLDERFRESLF